jgi:hypothetical protein
VEAAKSAVKRSRSQAYVDGRFFIVLVEAMLMETPVPLNEAIIQGRPTTYAELTENSQVYLFYREPLETVDQTGTVTMLPRMDRSWLRAESTGSGCSCNVLRWETWRVRDAAAAELCGMSSALEQTTC